MIRWEHKAVWHRLTTTTLNKKIKEKRNGLITNSRDQLSAGGARLYSQPWADRGKCISESEASLACRKTLPGKTNIKVRRKEKEGGRKGEKEEKARKQGRKEEIRKEKQQQQLQPVGKERPDTLSLGIARRMFNKSVIYKPKKGREYVTVLQSVTVAHGPAIWDPSLGSLVHSHKE